MPTIRIDDEVYAWLQSFAKPFEDNPNTVLRRVSGLDKSNANSPKVSSINSHPVIPSPTKKRKLSGKILAKEWNVDVKQALYHQDGVFYENLKRFPGALFDPDGYVIFETEDKFVSSPYLRIGKKLNVPNRISSIPGYKRMWI